MANVRCVCLSFANFYNFDSWIWNVLNLFDVMWLLGVFLLLLVLGVGEGLKNLADGFATVGQCV